MGADKYHHPHYLQMAQAIGINLSSGDSQKLARFINNVIFMTEKQEREACARLCDEEYEIRERAGKSHPENSEERGRCFSAARAARNCASAILARGKA